MQLDQLPYALGLDDQQLAVLERDHGVQVGRFVQYGLFADAFAGQDAGQAAVAGEALGFHAERAGQHDQQAGVQALDRLAALDAQDRAAGQGFGHGRGIGVAQQLQVADSVAGCTESTDQFHLKP
jgi:hypothetical protein